jgi:CheY-like chemotaxis protein
MTHDQPQILIVDDEPQVLRVLERALAGLHARLTRAADGEQALAALRADPERFDVVMLDRLMPRMDGMQCLAQMKAQPELAAIPVIMQTAASSAEDVRSGIRAGAFYYLIKPYDAPLLLAMVRAALDDRNRFRALQTEVRAAAGAGALLRAGRFVFRTPQEAEALAGCLSRLGPNPPMLALGLSELFWNAIEHGNLGIGYAEKAALVREGRWAAEVRARLDGPDYRDRCVEVSVESRAGAVRFRVRDQGAGFDWRPFLALDERRVFEVSGRGIAIANSLAFDALEFLGSGNEVVGTVRLPEPALAAG